MTGLLLLALLAQTCPTGQSISPDTAGHCCWPAQAWSSTRKQCIGVPACPGTLTVEGERCVLRCPEGQATGPDTRGNCCWPGQAWSSARSACVGAPSCPSGSIAEGERCVSASAPVMPQPVMPQPVMPQPDLPPPEPAPTMPPPASPPEPAPSMPPPEPLTPQPLSLPPETRAAELEADRRSGQPEPAPAPLEVSEKPAGSPGERYEKFGKFDLRLLLTLDFGAPGVQGLELDLAISFFRTQRLRLGAQFGLGYMYSVFAASEARTVVPLSTNLFFGVRLGESDFELIARAGAFPLVGVWRHGQGQITHKGQVGLEIFKAFTPRGSGLTAGFDFLFIDGFVWLTRVGWVF